MIASAQTLRRLRPVSPLLERQRAHGLTYGLGPCGIDLRVAEDVLLYRQGSVIMEPGAWSTRAPSFALASCMEYFTMPANLLGVVHDKSTWARMGLAVQNTVIEPGWRGYLTLELTYHGNAETLRIAAGSPICQVIFHLLDEPTDALYGGKYQDQKAGPQPARFEP